MYGIVPDQSKALTQALRRQAGEMGQGAAGAATETPAAVLAGWGGMLAPSGRGGDVVNALREKFTVGDSSKLMPKNLEMPRAVQEGAELFQRGADMAGAVHPALGAAVQTLPAAAGMLLPLRGKGANLGELEVKGPANKQKGMFDMAPEAIARQADMLSGSGMSAEEIWKTLGATNFGNKNLPWLHELDDSRSQVLFDKDIDSSAGGTLGDYLYHPELKAAHPDIFQTPLDTGIGSKGGEFWTRQSDRPHGFMSLRAPTVDKMKSVALHETQHNLANKLRLPDGSSPEAQRKKLIKAIEGGESSPQLQKSYLDFKLAGPKKKALAAQDWEAARNAETMKRYLADGGEAMARLTEYRQHMNAEQRRKYFPDIREMMNIPSEGLTRDTTIDWGRFNVIK